MNNFCLTLAKKRSDQCPDPWSINRGTPIKDKEQILKGTLGKIPSLASHIASGPLHVPLAFITIFENGTVKATDVCR